MDILRAGLPGQYGAGTNAPPPPPPKDEAAERIAKAKAKKARRRRMLMVASIVIVVLVIGSVYYFLEDSPYQTAIVSTTTTEGTITGISDATVSLSNGGNAAASANARITISTSYGTFNAFIPCWPTQYQKGNTTTVTVNTLRNGALSFSAPDLVCPRHGFQFSTSTTTTSKSSTA